MKLLSYHIVIINNSLKTIDGTPKTMDGNISLKEQSLLQPLQKVMLETSKETVASRKEILLLLNKLNLESQSLPNDIKEGLQKIALPLKYEKLSDFDAITLNIASERKKIKEKKRQYEEKQLALLYDDHFRKYTIFSRKVNCLQKAVNSLESIIENSQKEQADIPCFIIYKVKEILAKKY